MHFSSVIAGTMNWGQWGASFTTQQYLEIIDQCLEIGVTSFDHADIYGHYTTEEDFGRALQSRSSLRSRMQLITKCGIRMVTPNRPDHHIKSYDTSKAHIIKSAERSLQNLSTDYIDLLLIHRPDMLMDPSEIMEAVDILKTSGKILQFGVSNFLPQHMSLLRSVMKIQANQFEISAFKTDALYDGTLNYCLEHSIPSLSWSPLGGGVLQKEIKSEAHQRVVEAAQLLAKEYGVSYDMILLSWLSSHPARIIPVLGTTKIQRIKDAVQAVSITLNREQWYMILSAQLGEDVP
jgi:predicted oxidoreductase